MALFPSITDCEFNTETFIMKGFKCWLLKHTYGDPQQGPRKQFNCTISDRVLFNETNNQLLAALMRLSIENRSNVCAIA